MAIDIILWLLVAFLVLCVLVVFEIWKDLW